MSHLNNIALPQKLGLKVAQLQVRMGNMCSGWVQGVLGSGDAGFSRKCWVQGMLGSGGAGFMGGWVQGVLSSGDAGFRGCSNQITARIFKICP